MSQGEPQPRALPPGQRYAPRPRVLHYGPLPKPRPDTWDLKVVGATADGAEHSFDMAAFCGLPRARVVTDLHCVTRWSALDLAWEGVPTRALLELVPPADDVTHVLAWAEFGYSATLRLDDLLSPRSLLADTLGGRPLAREHGWPLRLVVPHLYAWKGPKWLRGLEFCRDERRGFWEERGYHVVGDAWREERYSYQEDRPPGDG